MYSVYKLNKQYTDLSTPFPVWNQLVALCPLLAVTCWPAYRFLRRQESGLVILSFLKNFLLRCDSHKRFSVINEVEVDIFLEFSCFPYDSMNCGSSIFVPLPFLNSSWTSGSSWFTYCWSLAWRILSIILLACEMSTIVWCFLYSLVLPLFGIGMKTDFFQSFGLLWVFQICWHPECST